MIYLLDTLNFELFEKTSKYRLFYVWETNESKVKGWIENERTRSIVDKQEVVNLFDIRHKIQVVPISKVKLCKYDKVIVWTKSGRYFVLELTDIKT